jgi:hypothetical protein
MLYVTIFSTAEGRYQAHLRDFVEPVSEQSEFAGMRQARAFAFADASTAIAFYHKLNSLPLTWLERLITHGLPEKTARQASFSVPAH